LKLETPVMILSLQDILKKSKKEDVFTFLLTLTPK